MNLEVAIKMNAHFLVDNHPLSLKMLQDWGEGYTLYEISQRHSTHVGVTKDILKFAFELLGRKLEISDDSVMKEIPQQLHPAARSVFSAYYDTFTELPERDQDI